MELAIIGAGNGGQAAAADLALQGHRVRLYDRFPDVTKDFSESRQITLAGVAEGVAVLDLVTNEIARAVEGVELILVTVPSFALEWVVREMGPYLENDQMVILHPGGSGGALETRHVWDEIGLGHGIKLGETDTLAYACRLRAPGEPVVRAIKQEIMIAALPANDNTSVLEAFSSCYPQAVLAPSVFDTSFANMNAVIHPAIALLNVRSIEAKLPGFEFYRDGVTASTTRLIGAVDAERVAIAAAFGVDCFTYEEWLRRKYGAEADDASQLFKSLAATVYRGMGAPESLESRYISEDVPMALVPMHEFGRLAGVETPAIHSIITIFSILTGRDYLAEGRTLARLGLEGRTLAEVRGLGDTGFLPAGERSAP
jgi:opine dehydrogenase